MARGMCQRCSAKGTKPQGTYSAIRTDCHEGPYVGLSERASEALQSKTKQQLEKHAVLSALNMEANT